MYLWLGVNVHPEWIQNVFGVQSAAQIDIDKVNIGKRVGCQFEFW